uniref:hypothetical protein n=1 Tax=Aeromonas rivipollensis TaxID=948519 RepID=UPI003D1A0C6B
LHAETALGTGRMTSTFECSKKWGDYPKSTRIQANKNAVKEKIRAGIPVQMKPRIQLRSAIPD